MKNKVIILVLLLVLMVVLLGINFPAFGNISLSVVMTILFGAVFLTSMFVIPEEKILGEDGSPLVLNISTSFILGMIFYFIEPSLSTFPGISPILLWVEFIVATGGAVFLHWMFTDDGVSNQVNATLGF